MVLRWASKIGAASAEHSLTFCSNGLSVTNCYIYLIRTIAGEDIPSDLSVPGRSAMV